jgi:hypothetical protein
MAAVLSPHLRSFDAMHLAEIDRTSASGSAATHLAGWTLVTASFAGLMPR